jgi:hypothetical protein
MHNKPQPFEKENYRMKHSSASLVIVASTKGTLSGLNRIAHLSGAITKFSAMLAVAALCVVSVGVSKAAANGIAEPAQTAPVAANNQAKPAAKPKTGKVTATQIDPAREAWRKAMLKAPRQKETCATATYPDQQWHEVQCVTPPNRPIVVRKTIRPHTVGGGGLGADVSLAMDDGYIEEGEGSFDKVEGVTSEQSNGVPNAFSLQINTNPFTTTACNTAPNPVDCKGWVQFVYDSTNHWAFIQYWLLSYGDTCPDGWTSDGEGDGGCLRNSHGISTPPVTIADLRRMKLYGSIGGLFGSPYDDVVAVEVGDLLYAQWSGDPIDGAVIGWQAMEFNVFGDGSGSEAIFNPGSTLVVRDSILHYSGTKFDCASFGWTGEMNNLTLSTKSPLVANVGPPSLVFIESYEKGFPPVGGCSNAALIQGTDRIPITPIIAHKP